MEKLQDEQLDETGLRNKIFTMFEEIAKDNGFNLEDIKPRQFNYVICEINRLYIQPNNKYLLHGGQVQGNYYNIQSVNLFYILYRDLCNKYSQECKSSLFSKFVNIPLQTLSEWLSTGHSDLLKIIHTDNEESLNELLLDKSLNPVKAISVLNYKHNWSGQIQAQEIQSKALAIDNLPNLRLTDELIE